MKEFFTGHKDSAVINEYLNSIPEDNAYFKVVYQLRKMGEKFNDGILTLREVSESFKWFQNVSDSTEAFIHQMRCWTFYTTLRAIVSGNELTPFEQRVKDEIEHPSFCKAIPKSKVALILYKLERIWYSRWKHPLVFNEPPFAKVITFIWSVVSLQKVVKD